MRVAHAASARPPASPPGPRAPIPPFRRKRLDDEASGLASQAIPPSGGPLGLHRAPDPLPSRPGGIAPAQAAAVVDRMIVGRTREGLAEVRMEVAVGSLKGTEVRLVAGTAGVEATFLAASESARRVVEAQLAELARALEGRGLKVASCEVTARAAPRRPDRDRRGRGSWEDAAE